MHTVKGVESSSPTPPQSHVQNVAATITAAGESPVVEPYSHGSRALPVSDSNTTNSPAVSSTGHHESDDASANASGAAALIHTPMYGMKRSSAASSPQSAAFGTRRKNRPVAINTPKAKFTATCACR